MVRIGLAGVLALWAGSAVAADEPVYAPPPAWVRPAVIPDAPASTDGTPVQTLLVDEQSKLGVDEDQFYVERAVKIISPEGFNLSNIIGKTWDPDTETLVIHRLEIIRGGTGIDVLAGGKKFLVLRRENNLELAMLDGRLTATIQPEGLQVGDIVDIATTVHSHDPALQGYSVDSDWLTHTGVASRVRMRVVWPASKDIRWRETEGLDAPKVTRQGEGTELLIDMANVETPKAPIGAPARFMELGSLELSQYGEWTDLSRMMSPLYEKAASLPPGSPLNQEIAKIAATSADPKVRATAALRLVEEQTRYVFLGMNDGGLVPADADETWARRFGDCKGKTALLVALLRALGIEADPTIVSTVFGDGMDGRLPMPSWFDHAIVRAQIAGKTYWLDGTRVGDRNIDDLVVPTYRWALPVTKAGSTLARLDPDPLTAPNSEESMKIDASKGPAFPAPTHIEILYRGESAAASRQMLASVPRTDYDRYLKEFWKKIYPWLEVSHVDVADDPVAGVSRLSADGSATVEWTRSADGAEVYHVPYTAMGDNVSFKRQPGPHQNAPFAVNYPFFDKRTKQIILPTYGDVVLVGDDIDKRAAGLVIHRRARIENGVLNIELSTLALNWEFTADANDTDGQTLRDLAKKDVSLVYRMNAGGRRSAAVTAPANTVEADQAAADKGDAVAQYRLAMAYQQGQGVPFSVDKAAGLLENSAYQGYAPAEVALGSAYYTGMGETRDLARAASWMRKAADQNDPKAQAAVAYLYSTGVGIAREDALAQAIVWAEKSAAQNNPAGEALLGQLYIRRNQAGDAIKSVALFQKAAGQGLASAEVELALAYRSGFVVIRNPVLATAWTKKAADQGDASGEILMADAYRQGIGVKRSNAEAMAWLGKAAEKGDVRAERLLGLAFLTGELTVVDKSKAREWFGKAAAGGDLVAKQQLALLDGQFTATRSGAVPPPPLLIPPVPLAAR
jgi:TPR repeat protein